VGQDTVGAAARAFRLLNSPELRQPPTAGRTERRATSTTPGTPLNLDLVDYLTEHVDEVIEHARAVATTLSPLPDRDGDLYEWYVDNTGHADDDQRRYRDTLIERHRLEHAVRLGNFEQVCRNPCPGCGRWGLQWDMAGNRAQCLSHRCRTPDGMSQSWTLARLAAQKVQRTEIWRANAT
jgi:hypothetical protein